MADPDSQLASPLQPKSDISDLGWRGDRVRGSSRETLSLPRLSRGGMRKARGIGRIDQDAGGRGLRRLCHPRGNDMARPENMEYGFTGAHQIVRNDPPMASPPQGLGAHDDAPPRMPELAQPREAAAEALAHGVVGVVVKALVLPERVDARRRIALLPAQAAERRNVLISDPVRRKRLRQRITVVLRVGARAGHGADIDHESHLALLQQVCELADWTGPVADGVEHQRRRCLNAVPLCRATWSVLSLLLS